VNVHIYRVDGQPATAFVDANVEPPMKCGYPPDKMLWCFACDECWPAAGMVAHVYYDGTTFYCAAGHGCKDPARIAKHEEAKRHRRSEGQRERWRRKREQENPA
jgi:hypothetical protein